MIIKVIFALIGTGMLIGAFYWYQHTADFIATAITAQGEVIDLQRHDSDDGSTYRPVVKFLTREGKETRFVSSAGSNPPSFDVGEKVTVFYAPDNPGDAKIDTFFQLWGGVAIVGGMGIIFAAIGWIWIVAGLLRKRMKADVKATGTRIQADFREVVKNTSYKVNGQSPYQIICQWQNPVTRKIHVFESDNIWFDPLEYIRTETIAVWVDMDDPDRYHMDISYLPELAD